MKVTEFDGGDACNCEGGDTFTTTGSIVSASGRAPMEVMEVTTATVADVEVETLRLPLLLLFDGVDGCRLMEATVVTEMTTVAVADAEVETLRLPPLLLFDSVGARRLMEVTVVTELTAVAVADTKAETL